MQRLALLAAAATALQRPPVIRRVEVEVTRQLDGVSPEHAREAWLDYSWTSGGGIPALILREPADAKLPSARTLVPAGLREELAYVDQTDDELVARYRVSDPGNLYGVSDAAVSQAVAEPSQAVIEPSYPRLWSNPRDGR